ncbi:MAG: hypothetical protein JWM41_4129 [Gemmatimonadetes bacterium]|nr:hypothetical protein [Gemmatimonadota bacterium]
MTQLRSAATALLLAASPVAPALAQAGRTIDEGTFTVARKGAATQTESFKIARVDNDLIQATGQLIVGDERISSSLMTDSLGTPLTYGFLVKSHGATTLDVHALAGGRRLSLKLSDNRSNESMRDFPIAVGRTLILDDWLLHQLYFVTLAKRAGAIQMIQPRLAKQESCVLTARGLEPVDVGGRSVTATHYSLVNGATVREFWVDAAGRVLRVEIAAQGLIATRDEAPR